MSQVDASGVRIKQDHHARTQAGREAAEERRREIKREKAKQRQRGC